MTSNEFLSAVSTPSARFMSLEHPVGLLDSIRIIKESPLRLSLDTLKLNINADVGDVLEKARETLRQIGLVEQKKTVKNDQICLTFYRPRFYRYVEEERERLGYWGNNASAPRYSVCVCNYNMGDTLERAMSSVARQLDPRLYEILVIDDGSSDDSLKVLEKLVKEYKHFRYISLPRDSQRKLGETRNISIRAARGEYVLIHIDADDEWEPYLSDLVTLFHRLENAIGHDFLLAGQQTGIGKRDFLLSYGPYENVYRCEDRNMMMKLAQKNILMFMDYRVYRTRLVRPIKKKMIKVLWDTCSSMMFEFRQNEKDPGHVRRTLLAPFSQGKVSLKLRILRAALVLPIYVISRLFSPVINQITWQELRQYHTEKRGTYSELMSRIGHSPDISFLSPEAQAIYSYNVKHLGFQGAE
jgi:glycosyltransferase involved in cell wall biosynthesis